MWSYNYIHFSSLVSLFAYVISLILLLFAKDSHKTAFILGIGLLSQFISLLLLITTEYKVQNTVSTIDSSPSLLLFMCSFLLILFCYLSRERSRVFTLSFITPGVLLFILGAFYFHGASRSVTYEVQPVLLIHIVFSIFSQLSVFFILILSFLTMLLHKTLKKRKLGVLHLPNLQSLEKMLIASLQGIVLFLSVALVSGILQGGDLLREHFTKFLFSLLYFAIYLLALFLYGKKKISLPVLSFYLFTSTLLLLVAQFIYRFL